MLLLAWFTSSRQQRQWSPVPRILPGSPRGSPEGAVLVPWARFAQVAFVAALAGRVQSPYDMLFHQCIPGVGIQEIRA